MRTLIKTLLGVGLAAALAAPATATGLAIYESDPHLGGTSFIAMTGRPPRTTPDIKVVCTQNGATVKQQKKPADAGGAYFTWAQTELWPSGGATCEAKLQKYTKQGDVRVLAELVFRVSG